jgi:XTP/dITP diphosphohydrolase
VGADDAKNNAKLLAAMRDVPAGAARRARFRCVAAFVDPARGIEIAHAGACEGEILGAERGDGGFGYDPLVLVPALGKTVAELAPDVKNRVSHRAQAAERMLALLRGEWRLG